MRLTIRHRYDFRSERQLVGSDLTRPESWDALRVESSGPFALPASREEWEAAAENAALRERARGLDQSLEEMGARTLASYGAGVGLLELWLHRLRPERALTLTDYAPEGVRRLSDLFPEARVVAGDLRTTAPLDADVHLFHRIDSEFSNGEWRRLLERFRKERLLIVATEILSPRRVLDEVLLRRPGSGAALAGWTRTRSTFEALWEPTHDWRSIDALDLPAWRLEPRGASRARG